MTAGKRHYVLGKRIPPPPELPRDAYVGPVFREADTGAELERVWSGKGAMPWEGERPRGVTPDARTVGKLHAVGR